MIVICYMHYRMVLRNGTSEPVRQGWLSCNDDDIASCFDLLVAGNNLTVSVGNGLRRWVEFIHANYRYVRAAGGVVQHPHGSRLLIRRNNRWDLPKGKVEQGESFKVAALREVIEETGVRPDGMGPLLAKTYHIYNLYGGWHFKQTAWFSMMSFTEQVVVPQIEEGIEGGEWVDPMAWNRRMDESYATMSVLAHLDDVKDGSLGIPMENACD